MEQPNMEEMRDETLKTFRTVTSFAEHHPEHELVCDADVDSIKQLMCVIEGRYKEVPFMYSIMTALAVGFTYGAIRERNMMFFENYENKKDMVQ